MTTAEFRMTEYSTGSTSQTNSLYSLLPCLDDALPLLESCVLSHTKPDVFVVRMADYGAALGQQSLPVFQRVIGFLNERNLTKEKGKQRLMFEIFLCDLPENDWTAAFQLVLNSENPGYFRPVTQLSQHSEDDVFVYGCGTSHYRQIHPPGSVHFAFSSTALHWLSCMPCPLHGKAIVPYQTCVEPADREAFHRQSSEDWGNHLRLRSRELTDNGVAVLFVLVQTDEIGQRFDSLSDALHSLREEGTITEEEETSVALQFYLPPESVLLEPFGDSGNPSLPHGLNLVSKRRVEVNDLLQATQEETIEKVVAFQRTLVSHTVQKVLVSTRTASKARAVVEELFRRSHENLRKHLPPGATRLSMVALVLQRTGH
eukprot:TRINITY_DN15557_c0_g1_i1.p1 TRINITY_DN15557_c0_g1~~TRINITY_DN15557_c0_g1_i1.p1  ORF type:complete len:379 (+),score=61.14 TRINITY_DN15557_c0_g1_i1:24-1139(+)